MKDFYPKGPVAYLTGEYPAVSHTFILREIEALRALGFAVKTCSIRQTEAKHHRGSSEKEAAQSTFYVLKEVKNPLTLFRAFARALARPATLFQAARLAYSTRPPGIRGLIYQLFYLSEAIVLAYHLKAQGVVHLHNHFGNSSCSVAMLCSVISDIPFSYTMHGPAIFFEPRHWRIDEKIARAKFVACISHFCRSQGMIFAQPQHWDKMRIVHCGVTPERYRPAKTRNNKTLIFVGRLAAVKGVLVLLDAFAQVLKAHPDAQLVLVGDGDERARIEETVARLGLSDAVRFTGYLSQDQVAEELAAADIFTLPSFAEGVPVVLMEAMASTMPVVATQIAGIPELVKHGVSGHIVPPGDANEFAQAVISLLDAPDQIQTMGEQGRALVAAEYDINKEAAWLAEILIGNAPEGALRPLKP